MRSSGVEASRSHIHVDHYVRSIGVVGWKHVPRVCENLSDIKGLGSELVGGKRVRSFISIGWLT